MRWVVAAVLFAACSTDNPSLVIERQGGTLAQASASGWTHGSVVLTGDPGVFTFPQSVSLRLTIVDDVTTEMPMQVSIANPKIEPYGSGQASLTVAPRCESMACTGEVSIAAAGSSMLAITADGPNGQERDCFYYAVADAGTDTDALKASLETQQRDCRFAKQ